MKWDGMNFKLDRTVAMLRKEEIRGGGHYVRFGKIVPQGRVPGPEAEEANLIWPGGQRVWAVPIPLTGYSLTNMAYGADGRIYLGYDAMCYTHRHCSTVANVMHFKKRLDEATARVVALQKERGRLNREIADLRKEQESMV